MVLFHSETQGHTIKTYNQVGPLYILRNSRLYIFKGTIFLPLMMYFILANSADTDKMPHSTMVKSENPDEMSH